MSKVVQLRRKPPNMVLAVQAMFKRLAAQREQAVVPLPIAERPQAVSIMYALRQRVLIGVVADGHRVYGRGRIRKLRRD